ncbi:MAG: NADPH-dependent FMN reductase [Flavobacteriales bacterium]
MKSIVAISGSANSESSNTDFLKAVSQTFASAYSITVVDDLGSLPLFTPQLQASGTPENVLKLRMKLANADAVIISTPEYIHNIPAALKNALEWITESGELHEKPVLPITFTPAAPRGEFAMKSLLQSLSALNAKVVAELPLYRNELPLANGSLNEQSEQYELLAEALTLL